MWAQTLTSEWTSDELSEKSVVFLVEDDDSLRRSLARLLMLVGYAVEEFPAAEDMLARLPYDGDGCVVTDVRMSGVSGLELQTILKESGCLLPLVFITGWGQVPDAVTALKEGALDFLEKPVDPEALKAAVKAAVEKGRRNRANRTECESARQLIARLTRREYQVCQLAARGLLNKQIAAELGTSEKTVKVQRGCATRKLNVPSVSALVDLLRKAGAGAENSAVK